MGPGLPMAAEQAWPVRAHLMQGLSIDMRAQCSSLRPQTLGELEGYLQCPARGAFIFNAASKIGLVNSAVLSEEFYLYFMDAFYIDMYT